MKKSTLILSMAAASAAMFGSAEVASAQTWNSIPAIATSSPGTGFWNNPSDDRTPANLPCNIGGLLTSAPGIAGCENKVGGTTTPFAGITAPTQYLNNATNGAAFFFGAGSWDIKLLGTITGANPVRPWSIVEVGGGSLGTITTVGTGTNIYTSKGFYLTISAWAPTGGNYRSDVLNANGRSQFAAFGGAGASSTGAQINWTTTNQTYFVGMEDNACLTADVQAQTCPNVNAYQQRPSDYDYNDIILSVTAVPEPSSVALMAAGLVGLAFAARRRRQA